MNLFDKIIYKLDKVTKRNFIIIFVFLFLIFITSLYLYESSDVGGICPGYGMDGRISCLRSANSIIEPVLLGSSVAVLIIFVKLIFPRAFRMWMMFALPYLIAMFALAIFAGGGGSGVGIGGGPDSEGIIYFFGPIFIVLSIILIIAKYIWLHKKGKEEGIDFTKDTF